MSESDADVGVEELSEESAQDDEESSENTNRVDVSHITPEFVQKTRYWHVANARHLNSPRSDKSPWPQKGEVEVLPSDVRSPWGIWSQHCKKFIRGKFLSDEHIRYAFVDLPLEIREPFIKESAKDYECYRNFKPLRENTSWNDYGVDVKWAAREPMAIIPSEREYIVEPIEELAYRKALTEERLLEEPVYQISRVDAMNEVNTQEGEARLEETRAESQLETRRGQSEKDATTHEDNGETENARPEAMQGEIGVKAELAGEDDAAPRKQRTKSAENEDASFAGNTSVCAPHKATRKIVDILDSDDDAMPTALEWLGIPNIVRASMCTPSSDRILSRSSDMDRSIGNKSGNAQDVKEASRSSSNTIKTAGPKTSESCISRVTARGSNTPARSKASGSPSKSNTPRVPAAPSKPRSKTSASSKASGSPSNSGTPRAPAAPSTPRSKTPARSKASGSPSNSGTPRAPAAPSSPRSETPARSKASGSPSNSGTPRAPAAPSSPRSNTSPISKASRHTSNPGTPRAPAAPSSPRSETPAGSKVSRHTANPGTPRAPAAPGTLRNKTRARSKAIRQTSNSGTLRAPATPSSNKSPISKANRRPPKSYTPRATTSPSSPRSKTSARSEANRRIAESRTPSATSPPRSNTPLRSDAIGRPSEQYDPRVPGEASSPRGNTAPRSKTSRATSKSGTPRATAVPSSNSQGRATAPGERTVLESAPAEPTWGAYPIYDGNPQPRAPTPAANQQAPQSKSDGAAAETKNSPPCSVSPAAGCAQLRAPHKDLATLHMPLEVGEAPASTFQAWHSRATHDAESQEQRNRIRAHPTPQSIRKATKASPVKPYPKMRAPKRARTAGAQQGSENGAVEESEAASGEADVGAAKAATRVASRAGRKQNAPTAPGRGRTQNSPLPQNVSKSGTSANCAHLAGSRQKNKSGRHRLNQDPVAPKGRKLAHGGATKGRIANVPAQGRVADTERSNDERLSPKRWGGEVEALTGSSAEQLQGKKGKGKKPSGVAQMRSGNSRGANGRKLSAKCVAKTSGAGLGRATRVGGIGGRATPPSRRTTASGGATAENRLQEADSVRRTGKVDLRGEPGGPARRDAAKDRAPKAVAPGRGAGGVATTSDRRGRSPPCMGNANGPLPSKQQKGAKRKRLAESPGETASCRAAKKAKTEKEPALAPQAQKRRHVGNDGGPGRRSRRGAQVASLEVPSDAASSSSLAAPNPPRRRRQPQGARLAKTLALFASPSPATGCAVGDDSPSLAFKHSLATPGPVGFRAAKVPGREPNRRIKKRQKTAVVMDDMEIVDCDDATYDGELLCTICQLGEIKADNDIVLCDGCNCAQHQQCCAPPIDVIGPDDEEWFCSTCTEGLCAEYEFPFQLHELVWYPSSKRSFLWPGIVERIDFVHKSDSRPYLIRFFGDGGDNIWAEGDQLCVWSDGIQAYELARSKAIRQTQFFVLSKAVKSALRIHAMEENVG